jgi:hypothetical protein
MTIARVPARDAKFAGGDQAPLAAPGAQPLATDNASRAFWLLCRMRRVSMENPRCDAEIYFGAPDDAPSAACLRPINMRKVGTTLIDQQFDLIA